jgi:N-glycosylase/DNA lyase
VPPTRQETQAGVLRLGSLPFSLEHTLLSGQAFRWSRENHGFVGVVSGNVLSLEQRGNLLRYASSPNATSRSELRSYLGVDREFRNVLSSLTKDPFVRSAVARFPGMRVLLQDPWETLISFIISSNNTILKVRRCVESLCRTFGDEIEGCPNAYSFPTPETLADATLTTLRGVCTLGYRDAYVRETAGIIARQPTRLAEISRLPYPEAKKEMMQFPGVGHKVADCVLLYSMRKFEAFPIDTWIKKIVESCYFRGERMTPTAMRSFAQRRFDPYAGYAQLYLFQAAVTGSTERGNRQETGFVY